MHLVHPWRYYVLRSLKFFNSIPAINSHLLPYLWLLLVSLLLLLKWGLVAGGALLVVEEGRPLVLAILLLVPLYVLLSQNHVLVGHTPVLQLLLKNL
jgi:hypothetical protein